MALDVFVQSSPGPPFEASHSEHNFSFEDDGYYWFLHPLFWRLREEIGQYIDLYGEATFGGELLDALGRTADEARRLVQRQPESWDVSLGIEMGPVPKEVRSVVHRQQMLKRIDDLEQAIHQAQEADGYVLFWGD